MRLGGSVGRVRPRGYQPGFIGEHDGLDAVAQAELSQDPANVDFHRALGQEQAGGDLAVGQASRDAGEDVLLAVGESLAELGGALRKTDSDGNPVRSRVRIPAKFFAVAAIFVVAIMVALFTG